MTTSRIFIAVLWVASLAAAYLLGGGTGDGLEQNGSKESAANRGEGMQNASDASLGEDRAKASRQFGDPDAAAPGGRKHVPTVVKRAALALAGGPEAKASMRGLRGLAAFANLDDAQIPEAVAEVERTVKDPQTRSMLFSLLLSQWAEKDGAAAMDAAEEKMRYHRASAEFVACTVLSTWARREPAAAWQWYQTKVLAETSAGLPRSPGRSESALFRAMATSDLDFALGRVGALERGSQEVALNGIADSITEANGRTLLLERSASLPPELQNYLRKAVMEKWFHTDAEGAVAWLRTLPQEQRTQTMKRDGGVLFLTRPDLAAEVILENSRPEDKARIQAALVNELARKDPRAAEEWLAKFPPGPELEAARVSYVSGAIRLDPARALVWAAKVQDPQQRSAGVLEAFSEWHARNPAAAAVGLKASGLPTAEIEAILAAAPRSKVLK